MKFSIYLNRRVFVNGGVIKLVSLVRIVKIHYVYPVLLNYNHLHEKNPKIMYRLPTVNREKSDLHVHLRNQASFPIAWYLETTELDSNSKRSDQTAQRMRSLIRAFVVRRWHNVDCPMRRSVLIPNVQKDLSIFNVKFFFSDSVFPRHGWLRLHNRNRVLRVQMSTSTTTLASNNNPRKEKLLCHRRWTRKN